MELVQFQEKYKQAFIDFNTDWIVSNFGFLEEHDKETFEKIDEELNKGAGNLVFKASVEWALGQNAYLYFQTVS